MIMNLKMWIRDRVKIIKKMVLIEIKHCIERAEYKVVFIALMILNIASYILCVKNDIGKSYQFIRSANENFVLQGTCLLYTSRCV